MFRRLFLAYLTLLVLALGVFGLLSIRSTRARVEDEIARRLEGEALVVAALVQAGPTALQPLLGEMGRRTDVRFTVIGADGQVMGESHADPTLMENHNSRPEVLACRAEGRGRNVRYSDTVRYDMMYFAVPVEPGRPMGIVVRAALPLTRIEEEMAVLYRAIAAAFFVVGLAGAGVTLLLARWITRPLRAIRTVAQAIASGDFSPRAPLAAAGEIGSVSRAINRMAEELSVRLEKLTAESSKLEAVLSSLEDGVVALAGTGEILHHNDAASRLLSFGRGFAGHKLWEAVRLPGFEEGVRRALQGGGPLRTTLEVGPLTLALLFCPLRPAGGAVLVVRDITEERRYDRLRKDFVANVSHELRTPLSVIRGYVETLKDGALKDEQNAPRFLDSIERNAQRLSALVEDLLDLSRLESGGQLMNPGPVEAAGQIEKVVEDFRPLADRKRQRLLVELPAGPVPLEADPVLLERALRNLVDNAVKYTPEGGSVTVGASVEGDEVVFFVRDTGMGIPAGDLPRIFERFYRVDKSRSRDLGGTGLGLAIVKHIAQLHGGSVSVESRVGSGSLFSVRLPVRSRAAPAPPGP